MAGTDQRSARDLQRQEEREEETVECEVRLGLTMVRKRVRKTDGRYLLYYDFRRDSGIAPAGRP